MSMCFCTNDVKFSNNCIPLPVNPIIAKTNYIQADRIGIDTSIIGMEYEIVFGAMGEEAFIDISDLIMVSIHAAHLINNDEIQRKENQEKRKKERKKYEKRMSEIEKALGRP